MSALLERELTKLEHGGHVCPVQTGSDERLAVVIPFVSHGLARDERSIYVGDKAVIAESTDALRAANRDFSAHIERGALQLLDQHETFLRSGEFTPKLMIEFLREAEADALRDGFSGLRFISEMAWTIDSQIDFEQLIEYEALLNEYTPGSESLVLCQYDRQRFDDAMIHDVLRAHPVAVLDESIFPNPYYEPPEMLRQARYTPEPEFKRKRIAWWIERLHNLSAIESERDEMAAALIDSEEHIRLLLDSTAEAICATDNRNRCTMANAAAARLLGVEKSSELLGQNMHGLMHLRHEDGSPYPEEECPIYKALVSGSAAHSDQEVFWRADGTSFPVEYWSHPIMRGRESIGAVVTYLDISERKELETRLRQAQKMEAIGNLSGGIAHDFNNILLVIRAGVALLDERIDNPDMRKDVERIDAAARRAAGLTHQLLVFSRRQVMRPESVNLNEVVADMRGLLDTLLGENISIVYELESHLDQILADRSQLGQVILNLAVNARDAMPEGGQLVIRTTSTASDRDDAIEAPDGEPGRHVSLQIIDDGFGMDADTKRRVFEPFFTTKDTGTGIGLATVYFVVDQSGGQVTLESEPGIGTTFTVRFPVVDETIGSWTKPSTPERIDGDETIMLVEDDDSVRSLVAAAVSRHGYKVIEASNGDEALAVATDPRAAIDLVVTDVLMPGMNGRVLSERLRALDPRTRVIYTSGYSSDILDAQGIDYERDDFIEKPYLPNELVARIRWFLNRRGSA